LAIASLVLGILWICGLGSLLAIVFGAIALGATRSGRKSGKGFAIAGLVLGIIGVLATAAVWILVVTVFSDNVTGTAGERNDVTITNCARDADGHGVATLKITNDSSKASSYFVSVEFRTASGNDTADNLKVVDRLEPDKSTTVDVRSPDPIGGPVRCRVDYVNRTSITFDTGS
jgi:hypothetical protein